MPRPVVATAAIAAALVALAGCSGTSKMSQSEAESQISSALEDQVGQAPDDVTCPGDISAEVGETMRCELTAGGDTYGLTMEITSVEGDKAKFDIEVDDEPKG